MADSQSPVTVTAELRPDIFEALKELARRRGLNANAVLQEAISTAKLISDNVRPNDKLLIKHPNNTYSQVLFSR